MLGHLSLKPEFNEPSDVSGSGKIVVSHKLHKCIR